VLLRHLGQAHAGNAVVHYRGAINVERGTTDVAPFSIKRRKKLPLTTLFFQV